VDGYLVDEEVEVARDGMSKFALAGLPDAAMKEESTERVAVALNSQGYRMPAAGGHNILRYVTRPVGANGANGFLTAPVAYVRLRRSRESPFGTLSGCGSAW
jgi:hypothetical protein